MEIAKLFGISQKSVHYWLVSDEKRHEIINATYEIFKNKTPEERKSVYRQRLPYLKAYRRNRYKNDSVFREKEKARFLKYYHAKAIEEVKGGK